MFEYEVMRFTADAVIIRDVASYLRNVAQLNHVIAQYTLRGNIQFLHIEHFYLFNELKQLTLQRSNFQNFYTAQLLNVFYLHSVDTNSHYNKL